MTRPRSWAVRMARPGDIEEIIAICQEVYPESRPWKREQLESHQRVFPEGQLVAVDEATGELGGFAASLIVRWDDYDHYDSWTFFTNRGYFTNHDPEHGRTLYGAEIMVRPGLQGQGIGGLLYRERRELAERLGLLRIRAGARLRGYGRFADTMAPEEYALKVIAGDIRDPTLSFQLSRGFRVLDVVAGYLKSDPESLGYAAVIEWLNADLAEPSDYEIGNPAFRIPDNTE